jgi:chromosome segregation ATPase
VPTMTIEERLAEMRRQIDELEATAHEAADDVRARAQRQLDALRRQEEAARAAARLAVEGFTEQVEQFDARLRLAWGTVTADLAEGKAAFSEAIEDELQTWDSYLERLQAQTALRAASTRQAAEDGIRDLRRRRNDVAARLADVRVASEGAWELQKQRLTVARDDLQRKADELAERYG